MLETGLYAHFVSAPSTAKDLHINYNETLAIVITAKSLGGSLQ